MAASANQSAQPPMNQAIPAESQPQQAQPQTQTDVDPVAKVKVLLLPRLKDSLVVCNGLVFNVIGFRGRRTSTAFYKNVPTRLYICIRNTQFWKAIIILRTFTRDESTI